MKGLVWVGKIRFWKSSLCRSRGVEARIFQKGLLDLDDNHLYLVVHHYTALKYGSFGSLFGRRAPCTALCSRVFSPLKTSHY